MSVKTMEIQDIYQIRKKILRFVLIVIASIFLTITYLVWMNHQTYTSQKEVSQALLPKLRILSEIRGDVLSISLDAREYFLSTDREARAKLVTNMTSKGQMIEQAFSRAQMEASNHPALAKRMQKLNRQYHDLSQSLKHLILALPADQAWAGSPQYLFPIHEQVQAIVNELDQAIKSNIARTDVIFNDMQSLEYGNTRSFLLVFSLLMGMLYYAGLKTYQSIIRLLGCEPQQFLQIVNALLAGTPVKLATADKDSLISSLKKSILTDKDTAVLNRLGLMQSLAESLNKEQPHVAVLVNVQGFEELADFIGSNDARQLLQHLVIRLKKALPHPHILTRISNASFLMIYPHALDENALKQDVEAMLALIQDPYLVGIRKLKIKVFAGIARYPDDTTDLKTLETCANTAAIHAEKHNWPIVFFTPEHAQEIQRYVEIETALSHALDNREFEIYLQPQVNISNHAVVGAEALIRWKHPLKGFIPPDKFIPMAERNGQIIEIGNWVLEQAMQMAVEVNTLREQPIPISINMSSYQIQQDDFYRNVIDRLTSHGCKPEWIKLEITESALLDKSDKVLRTLFKIASSGIVISLDDFGTGYSSLSYLTRYPISQIKIDRSFMNDIPLHLDNTELVKAIIKLAEILHCEVVAEGIENPEQLGFLQPTSCQLVQGYYFYKPMPFEAFRQEVVPLTTLVDQANA